jgi:hypothetical protein
MKKVLQKLKAAFSRGRRRRRKDNKDKGEDARVADLQLWARVSFCFRLLRDSHHPPIQPRRYPSWTRPHKMSNKGDRGPYNASGAPPKFVSRL